MKDATFAWNDTCQRAIDELIRNLTSAPLLVFPSPRKLCILKTDASIGGLGAVLSHKPEDLKIHPIGYANRSLFSAERNYGITELETLTVVWALTHLH